MLPCRLYFDLPADGAWNMAVDEALARRAVERDEAALRFYQWREPTLSLGYFQAYADREGHAASGAAAVVRRFSGGGALIHDRELTYSLALPPVHELARNSWRLYEVVHLAVVEALAALGVRSRLQGTAPRGEAAGPPESFLCFERRSEFDVVIAPAPGSAGTKKPPAKIGGSAQRRFKGATLQHGALLLSRSLAAPELPGISELTGIELAPGDLMESCRDRLAQHLQLTLSPAASTADEPLESISRLVEKYSGSTWTKRR